MKKLIVCALLIAGATASFAQDAATKKPMKKDKMESTKTDSKEKKMDKKSDKMEKKMDKKSTTTKTEKKEAAAK